MKQHCFRVLTMTCLAGALCLVPFTGLAEEATLTARDIMLREHHRPDGNDREWTMTMTLINDRGSRRIRELNCFSRDFGEDKKSVMIFREPADVKGTAFLSWEYEDPEKEDDKWIYMPALRNIRRIVGTARNEYFMGSDFTYDDMGDRGVDEDTHTLLGRETVLGHECWKIECVPVDPDEPYARRIVWVSDASWLILRAEYHDAKGLMKVYRALEVRQQDGFWEVYRSEMDHPARNHKTLMEVSAMRYDTGLDEDAFTVAAIQRGRVR